MVATKRENTSARQAHFEFPYSMFVVHCSPDISIISYTFVDCDHPSSTYILSFKNARSPLVNVESLSYDTFVIPSIVY